jgi:hypothetical protein
MEAARQAFAAVGRRDLPGLLEHLDPEIELNPVIAVWPRTYRGHAGIEEWFREVGDLWDEFSADVEGFRNLGKGTLIVRLHWRGRGKGGASEIDGPAAAVIRFDGEKMVSVDVHLDEERAVASVPG